MKTLRRLLIVLGTVALVLLGITQLGGTPIYKGYDTGFQATTGNTPVPTLVLSTDVGDLTCWLRMRVPATSTPVSASLSNGIPLSVYHESVEGQDQWVAVVADGYKREEKFKWPSGTQLFLTFKHGDSAALNDWRVYLSDKDFDSRDRTKGRTIAFYFSALCLLLGLVGAGLEAYAKYEGKASTFTYERYLEQLILSVEGKDAQETEWMQSILKKVSLQGVSAEDAIAPLPLKEEYQKQRIWFKARENFNRRLDWLILELSKDQEELMKL